MPHLDPDATGYVEPPETPAPVFAVRAFKHAIFGTPQTNQPKPRRNSTTENGRPRNADSRPARPGMPRPKSTSDAQGVGRQMLSDLPDPLSSPTKGILLTPGTAATKKKNVTFGDHVVDNEEKRPIKNDITDESPPHALSVKANLGGDSDLDDELPDKHRSRSKLTEALEQARDESKKRRSKTDKRIKKLSEDYLDVPPEYAEPKSDVAKYWKHAFEDYRTTTEREVKKLITKQRAAKSFAQDKEKQCTELADELREEQKKVETLEAKMEELTTLMKDLSEELTASRKKEADRADELVTLQRRTGRKDSTRPESGDFHALQPLERTTSGSGPTRDAPKPAADPVQRPSEPYQAPAENERRRMDLQTYRARVRAKPESKPPQQQSDDIWAQPFGSSSPIISRSAGPQLKGGRNEKANPDAPPTNALQTLDVNSLATDADSGREVSLKATGEQPHQPLQLETAQDSSVAWQAQQWSQLPPQSPSLRPPPPPQAQKPWSTDSKHTQEQQTQAEDLAKEDWSLPLVCSSPIQPERRSPPPLRRAAAPAGPREAPTLKPGTGAVAVAKENISPLPTSSKSHTPALAPERGLQTKPSALWSSMSAPPANQRATNTAARMSKEGKEVSGDRLEAARARVNARGRVAT